MTIFYEPTVHLVCKPQLDWAGVKDFFQLERGQPAGGTDWRRHEPGSDGELLCELMGRMCYGAFGDKQGRCSTRNYLENILDQGHGSVLEHACYSFLVCRAGRGYTHQQVRHRAGWAYSQESTHFVKYGADCRFSMCGCPESDHYEVPLHEAVTAYAELQSQLELHFEGQSPSKKKAACGQARALLPNALESKIGMTANIRALRHFVEMRGAEANTVEIRFVASKVAAIMQRECPFAFSDFHVGIGGDGFPIVTGEPRWRKV